jgi:hypothetical protein
MSSSIYPPEFLLLLLLQAVIKRDWYKKKFCCSVTIKLQYGKLNSSAADLEVMGGGSSLTGTDVLHLHMSCLEMESTSRASGFVSVACTALHDGIHFKSFKICFSVPCVALHCQNSVLKVNDQSTDTQPELEWLAHHLG